MAEIAKSEVCGRLVKGHPMIYTVPKDKTTGLPKLQKDGVTPRKAEMFVCVAIPKGPEQHWNQTLWGKLIWEQGQAGYQQGQWQLDKFSWKVTDGDSTKLSKNMTRPCDSEGYPGHWILNFNSTLALKCYIHPNYGPMDVVSDLKSIKTGDYCWVLFTIEPNNKKGVVETPGVYINIYGFSMMRAGQEIVTGVNPAAEFANNTAPQLPPGAQLDPAVGAPQPPPPADAVPPPSAPNMGFLNPPAPPREPLYSVAGKAFTKGQLIAAGWNEAQIAALPPSTGELAM